MAAFRVERFIEALHWNITHLFGLVLQWHPVPRAAHLVREWAYWVGEITQQQRDDSFAIQTHHRWSGEILLPYLTQRLRADHPLVDLNLHTVSTLIRARPQLQHQLPKTAKKVRQCCEILLEKQALTKPSQDTAELIYRALQPQR